MSEDHRIATVERVLRVACEKVRAAGHVLIGGDFQVGLWSRAAGRRVVGCCAWGAACLVGVDTGVKLTDDEYDAIEEGWDSYMSPGGLRTSKPLPWFALGRRLAAAFQPVPASSLEAR